MLPQANKNPRPSLHEHLVRVLGLRIVGGDVGAGDTLPVEDRLASEFGVSRTVVREAIKVLARKGLVQVRPRTGTRVRPAADWTQIDPDIMRWRLESGPDPKFLSDIAELRRLIEPAAAGMAAARASDAAIARIEAAFRAMSSAHALDRHIESDLTFHLSILEASGNDLLVGLRGLIEGALTFAIHLSTPSKKAGETSMQLHQAVMHAIRKRDAAAAEEAMRHVVQRWIEDSKRVLKSRDGKNGRARLRAVAGRSKGK